MHSCIGLKYIPAAEELISLLPGANRDIYEDDAEDVMEQIAEKGAMQPFSAWKKMTVTGVQGKTVEIDGITLNSPFLAERLSEGEELYGAVVTAGEALHKMLAECDDLMQEYILGFLMSHILTAKMVDVAEELCSVTGLSCVHMIVPGIPEVCAMDQQVQVAGMLEEEFKAGEITVNKGGNLSPAYSSTAFFLLSDGEKNIPADWTDRDSRNLFGKRLFAEAGHS